MTENDQKPFLSDYLRTPQIIKRLGICKSSWLKWVRKGIAPAGLKIGQRMYVWKKEDIENFIKNFAKVEAKP